MYIGVFKKTVNLIKIHVNNDSNKKNSNKNEEK